ncbi:T-complex 10 C-terminal domain-containing protein [Pantoea agglomerans]|uniref:T-complex 10 C-terminal domain-containing protein n=1 Tax=Enterobacter agglomerans TaxID=549 RepID=UPI00320AA2E3
MNNPDEPKITKMGVNTISEYADGKKVVESSGHKVTIFPDGTVEAELGGGHKTVMSPNGEINITFNYSVIKRVFPMNAFNVESIDTQDNGDVKVKEITFTNGGKLYIGYGKNNEIVSIAAINVGHFEVNKDGTEVGFDLKHDKA